MPNILRGDWSLWLPHAAGDVWPILSDTKRFNELSGLPRYQLEETAQADGSVLRIARARVANYKVAWEELPVDWVAGEYFFQRRLFLNGPLRHMDASLTLTPEGAGTRMVYEIAIASRRPLIGPYVAGRLINGAGRTFALAVRGADEFLSGARPAAYELGAPVFQPGGGSRLKEIISYLQAGPYDHGLSRGLGEFLISQPDADACHIRPKTLARQWGVDTRHAIEICLAAVRSGLLRLTWDLLCPRCRGAKLSTERLDTLQSQAHCPSCNVDYDADFNRNVELVFHPAAAIRVCPEGEYCMSGPQTTPHVLVQQSLAAGECRKITATLPPGNYRLRTLARGPELDFSYDGGEFPPLSFMEGAVSICAGEAPGRLVLTNAGALPICLVIESREWIRDALTAHQVTTLQTFRHLFPDHVLIAGGEMSIDSVTLMFTDLQGSTALYREIGDGPAYQKVREHFDILTDIVRAHDGALVKTIGDAVMAAFCRPQQAVQAAIAIQKKISQINSANAAAVSIKMGLHYGRCIVVNLNDRLDYFGTTVNLAARLQAQSRGGDIILSEELCRDPLVGPILDGCQSTSEATSLKGFERPIDYRRIQLAG
ncbi:MAG TPA: adenylate/guanylate cyclase domain-containing protein [Alphaproteobacteria bacterium]|nr:adenylate/guanylate cyclase domain-containing protein [Alphaproteobacteria bacterium]